MDDDRRKLERAVEEGDDFANEKLRRARERWGGCPDCGLVGIECPKHLLESRMAATMNDGIYAETGADGSVIVVVDEDGEGFEEQVPDVRRVDAFDEWQRRNDEARAAGRPRDEAAAAYQEITGPALREMLDAFARDAARDERVRRALLGIPFVERVLASRPPVAPDFTREEVPRGPTSPR